MPSVDIVDTKPANMEDLTEVITAAQFHPTECGMFVYCSSKGLLRLCDLRSQALCDRNAKGINYCVYIMLDTPILWLFDSSELSFIIYHVHELFCSLVSS